jgi:nicotinic acid mononucleotide adenylyltransferase
MTTLEPYQDDNPNPQILFTIGRMNPPTPGHLLLIKQMIKKAAFLKQNKSSKNECMLFLI